MSGDDRPNFFVSYNGADRNWAEWIAVQLEHAGFTTVIQAWDFRPGMNFIQAMQSAASRADRTIAVLSPKYLAAQFTQPEWQAAFAQDPVGEKGTLLPIRVEECELVGLWPQIVYIDLVGKDESAARQAILDGVKLGRVQPKVVPFPSAAPRAASGAIAQPRPPRFPGTLPPIWNVPHLRNPNFVGRDETLTALRSALESGQRATSRTTA